MSGKLDLRKFVTETYVMRITPPDGEPFYLPAVLKVSPESFQFECRAMEQFTAKVAEVVRMPDGEIMSRVDLYHITVVLAGEYFTLSWNFNEP